MGDARPPEDLARTILESIADAFFAVDRDWRFTYVNHVAERMLDRQPGDLVGKIIWEQFPGLVGSEFEKAYRKVAAEQGSQSLTAFYPDHNRWYEARVYPAPDGGLSIYFQDVSDRKRAEQELRESVSLLQGISDSTGDVIFAKDRQGRMRFANPAALALIGKPLKQVIGKTDAEFLNDKWAADRVMENDRRIMETDTAEDIEEAIPLPDGTERIWLSRKMPYRDGSGNVIGILGMSRDITERKRSVELVRNLYAVAAALSEAVTPADVARVIVSQGITAVGATAGSLALLTEDGTSLQVTGYVGYPPEVMAQWSRFSPDAPIPMAQAAKLGEPVYTTSPQERLARYPSLESLNAQAQTKSSACLPMTIGGRTVAVLGMSFSTTGHFSAERKELFVSLARQCGQALERARLFEAEQNARAEAQRAEAEMRDLAQRLERQSRLFERIASSTPDFIYVFDLQGRFLYANRSLLEVWGVTFEQARGKSLHELGYPDWHAKMHLRELRQVIETRQPITGEVPFTGGSGISGIYEYIFTPVLGPDGNVEVIAGTTRDVTARRKTEQRTARDAMLLANVQDAVIVCDISGVVKFWNQGAEKLFGQSAEEMLNRHYAERFPEAARAEVVAWIERLADTGEESGGEWHDYRKDGSRVWIEGSARRITSSAMPPFIMGVCRDITARKHAETERETLLASEKAARGEAERASRMKDEFLATLSHELRTPLNAILGWATILAGDAAGSAELREGLETIQRNARAQTQIIEDLLDMSRIISGKVRLEVQRTDLDSVVRAAVETVRPAADAKGVRLRMLLDPHAGPVTGDPARLQQVFWNLLSNAVKFTPKGGQVQVMLEKAESNAEVTVTDTGEGIPPDFLPHVFDRFRQADGSTTRRHGGLGLGLAIVKQLVELHGGIIRVKSPGMNQGSSFTVSLPLTVLHADPRPQYPAHLAGETTDGKTHHQLLTGVRVLVVDDEPDARALVKRLLEDSQAVVCTASSADEALRAIEADRPDVLVSDIGMPGEDGYTLIRKLRQAGNEKRTIPAVALTAYARTEDRVRAIRAGFQSHVVKPVDPAELIAVIGSLTGRAGE